MNCKFEKGLRIRCYGQVDMETKDLCIEFGKWLRKNIDFSFPVTIYVKDIYKSKITHGKDFSASFLIPLNKNKKPIIRVAVRCNESDALNNRNDQIISIFHSIAHEITHYLQWIGGLEFDEKDAIRNSKKLVRKYLKERDYDLDVLPSSLKLLQLADKYLDLNNYKKAITYYNDAINSGVRDYKAYNNIAYCYDCLEMYEKAILYYDKSLKINDKVPNVLLNKGYALHQIGQYERAIEYFNKSLNIKHSKEAYVFKAYSLEKLSEYNTALECYQLAINLEPDYDIAYNSMGQLLCHIGRYDDAKNCCSKAISIDPNYADAYYNLSIVYAKLKDIENATKNLNNAIKIDKDYKKYAIEETMLKENVLGANNLA